MASREGHHYFDLVVPAFMALVLFLIFLDVALYCHFFSLFSFSKSRTVLFNTIIVLFVCLFVHTIKNSSIEFEFAQSIEYFINVPTETFFVPIMP